MSIYAYHRRPLFLFPICVTRDTRRTASSIDRPRSDRRELALRLCRLRGWRDGTHGSPPWRHAIIADRPHLDLADSPAFLRHVAGGVPNSRLNARLNAASDS